MAFLSPLWLSGPAGSASLRALWQTTGGGEMSTQITDLENKSERWTFCADIAAKLASALTFVDNSGNLTRRAENLHGECLRRADLHTRVERAEAEEVTP
jgi:uncharacterized protein (DUF2235 family)